MRRRMVGLWPGPAAGDCWHPRRGWCWRSRGEARCMAVRLLLGTYLVPEAAVVVVLDLGDGHDLAVAGRGQLHFGARVVELGPDRRVFGARVAGTGERGDVG